MFPRSMLAKVMLPSPVSLLATTQKEAIWFSGTLKDRFSAQMVGSTLLDVVQGVGVNLKVGGTLLVQVLSPFSPSSLWRKVIKEFMAAGSSKTLAIS